MDFLNKYRGIIIASISAFIIGIFPGLLLGRSEIDSVKKEADSKVAHYKEEFKKIENTNSDLEQKLLEAKPYFDMKAEEARKEQERIAEENKKQAAANQEQEKTGIYDTQSFNLRYGTLLESHSDDNGVLVVKAKISPSYSNRTTINQNGYNVGDLIKNQGADKFNEIQYWAVADMTDGSESKVISFTLNKDLIAKIKEGSLVDNKIVDNAQDVWILPSLRS